MKLSVVTTSYNSQEFIEETILSVLSQEIQEDIEYIISDDASSDKTVEIVKTIAKDHPRGNCIRLIERKENVGVMKNFFGAVLETRGDYIAFCDSDDVWSDPDKFKKQVDYLEKNKGCTITYHSSINKVHEDLDAKQFNHFEGPVNQVIKSPQTSTMMVRGILLRELINKNVVNEAQGPQNDQYLRFLLQNKGYFKLLNHIEPNTRLIREDSIFSTVDHLTKKRKALHSWQTFYKYHGFGKNKLYLAKKVEGFKSSVIWSEYKKNKNIDNLFKALMYDIRSGVYLRKLRGKLKKIVFSPFVQIKHKLLE